MYELLTKVYQSDRYDSKFTKPLIQLFKVDSRFRKVAITRNCKC